MTCRSSYYRARRRWKPPPQGLGDRSELPSICRWPTAQAWDYTSRVNILVLGLDYRDWLSGGGPRTDTMILVSMDPASRTMGFCRSRDLWVNIPGFETTRSMRLTGWEKSIESRVAAQAWPCAPWRRCSACRSITTSNRLRRFEKFIDGGGVKVTVPEGSKSIRSTETPRLSSLGCRRYRKPGAGLRVLAAQPAATSTGQNASSR
jgi:hypothetical protein